MNIRILPRFFQFINRTQLRCITTKEPTSSTAAAAAPLVQPTEEDLKSVKQTEQSIVGSHENSKASLEKWQKKTSKYSVETKFDPIHTCMTFKEFTEDFKASFCVIDPEIEKHDTLPKHEWHGVFQSFGQKGGISNDTVFTLRTILGAKGTSRSKLYSEFKHDNIVDDQKYRPERVEALGPDLSAAHFAIYRGGRVRFHGNDAWYIMDINEECELPDKEQPGWNLQEVNASKMTLYYNGLENFKNCNSLEILKLFGNDKVDNFFIDRICHHFSDSLTSLDIGYCNNISIGGLTSLVRLRKLKHLVVSGLKIPHLALACMCLEEELPGLEIIGINYPEGITENKVDDAERDQLDKDLECHRIVRK